MKILVYQQKTVAELMVRAIRLLKAGSQYRKNDSVLFYLLKKHK